MVPIGGQSINHPRFIGSAKVLVPILIMTLVLCVCIVGFFAVEESSAEASHQFSVDGIHYAVVSDGKKTVEVLGCEVSIYESLVIPSVVNHDGQEYSVVSIVNNAFKGNSHLTSLVIPDSVTSIGKKAFDGCSGLTSVVLGQGIKGIHYSSFTGCKKVNHLTLPISFKANGYFDDMKKLKHVTFTKGTGVGHDYSDTTRSQTPWFLSRDSLTRVDLSDGITHIGKYTFYKCRLTSFIFPDAVKVIGKYAFYKCDQLRSVMLSKSIESIDSCAFMDCKMLVDIYVMGGDCIKARTDAFYKCSHSLRLISGVPGYSLTVYVDPDHVSQLSMSDLVRGTSCSLYLQWGKN